ncbi:hypothetical protein D3C85_1074210 [compost metagenome]
MQVHLLGELLAGDAFRRPVVAEVVSRHPNGERLGGIGTQLQHVDLLIDVEQHRLADDFTLEPGTPVAAIAIQQGVVVIGEDRMAIGQHRRPGSILEAVAALHVPGFTLLVRIAPALPDVLRRQCDLWQGLDRTARGADVIYIHAIA